jgi:3-hydroxyacyl-CoA dehydrogenase/enoyl-CoA hydratase/3-hydroxybutyryl-CoA epimerase
MSAHSTTAAGGGAVRWEHAVDGVIQVALDTRATAGGIDAAVMAGMVDLASHIAAHRASITGVIIGSETPGWFGRTDLSPVAALAGGAAPDALAQACAELARALRQIEQAVPTVAVIAGSALGTGLEIALACHHRIVLDDGALQLGLPDIGVGLLPAAGGAARVARMLGFVQAFKAVLAPGAVFGPQAALSMGLVSELVTDAAALLPAARRWLAGHATAVQPWDVKGWQMPGGSPASGAHYFTLHALPALLRKEHPCLQCPAPLQLLAAVVEGASTGDFQAAVRVEQRHVLQVLRHPSTPRLVQVLHADLQRLLPAAELPVGAPALREQLARPWVLGTAAGALAAVPGAQAFAECVARGLAQQVVRMLEEGVALPSVEQAARTAGFQGSAVALVQRFKPSALPPGAQSAANRSPQEHMPLEALQRRLLEAGAREAVRCLQAGPMSEPGLANSISVFGAGYPAWTGGALRHAQALGIC